MHLFEFFCESCEYTRFKRMSLAERNTKEFFCDNCGEQVAPGRPVEETCK